MKTKEERKRVKLKQENKNKTAEKNRKLNKGKEDTK